MGICLRAPSCVLSPLASASRRQSGPDGPLSDVVNRNEQHRGRISIVVQLKAQCHALVHPRPQKRGWVTAGPETVSGTSKT